MGAASFTATMKSSWDDIILSLTQFMLWIVNVFVVSSSPGKNTFRDSYNNNTDSSGTDSGAVDDELIKALKYFEITHDIITREYVKKQYKRLCLVHHPDRNCNTEESVQEMQRINHYFNLLEDELDRREGIDTEGEDVEEEEEEREYDGTPNEDFQGTGTDDDLQCPPQQQRDTSQQRKRRHRKECRRQRRRYQRAREKMEQEMKREWDETLRQVSEFKLQQKILRRNNRQSSIEENLNTAWGRDQAHATYMSEVDVWKMQEWQNQSQSFPSREHLSVSIQDIDDDQNPVESTASDKTDTTKLQDRPTNPLMQYCNEEKIVAMRLGKTDVAIDILQEELRKAGQEWLYLKIRSVPVTSVTCLSIQVDSAFYKRMFVALTQPLDEENNSILHYAVYWEDYAMISFLAHVSRHYQCFPEVIAFENIRCMCATDYTLGCSRNSNIPGIMEGLTKEAKEAFEERKLTTKLWRRVNQSLFQRPLTFEPLIRTFACLLFGNYVMNCRWILSMIITGLWLSDGDRGQHFVKSSIKTSQFFSMHVGWIFLRQTFALLWKLATSIPWEFQFISLIAAPFSLRLKHLSLIYSVISYLMKIIDQFFTDSFKLIPMFKGVGAPGISRQLIEFAVVSAALVGIRLLGVRHCGMPS